MDEQGTFSINYENIMKANNLLAVTKMLASDMQRNAYMTPGDFMKNLSDGDLHYLVGLCEEEDNEHFAELMLMAEMLAQGEGLPRANEEQMMHRVNGMVGFIVCESLARRGMVKIHRENMSFGEDMAKAVLVERIDENDN
jgi:predicted secreted protein